MGNIHIWEVFWLEMQHIRMIKMGNEIITRNINAIQGNIKTTQLIYQEQTKPNKLRVKCNKLSLVFNAQMLKI